MHCFEVVGYCHPNEDIAAEANWIYMRLVSNMHVYPEGREEMMKRLTEDRIAAGTVVS